jgi:hypothetical protein
MERYFQKRIRSLDLDDNAACTSRPTLRLKHSTQTQREIDLDEFPYDSTDRKRIS